MWLMWMNLFNHLWTNGTNAQDQSAPPVHKLTLSAGTATHSHEPGATEQAFRSYNCVLSEISDRKSHLLRVILTFECF